MTTTYPDKVPFDHLGSLCLTVEPFVFGQCVRETGELFIYGEDFCITQPNGNYQLYRDMVVKEKMEKCLCTDVFMEPDWRNAGLFTATMRYYGYGSDDCGRKVYYVSDEEGRVYPVLTEQYQPLAKTLYRGSAQRVKGNWRFVQVHGKYGVELVDQI